MLKAYKYRLYPSKAQQLLLEQTLETCRRWYNTCLAERKEAYENEKGSVGKFEQLRKVKELKQSNPFDSFGLKEYSNSFNLEGRRLNLSLQCA